MCGIAGGLSFNAYTFNQDNAQHITKKLTHRGPDGSGLIFYQIQSNHFSTQKGNLFFGHTRLAIQDLSTNASQPMSDDSKKIWITYNGEIYNFRNLRNELETYGYIFHSNSDTEVIIYAYKHWGIECVKKFNGMFAFGLFDSRTQKLYLTRDRYGIKPLYYHYVANQIILFASETKAILAHESYTHQLDKEALVEYFTFQNIFSDKTFHKNIHLLEAGHYIELDTKSSKFSKTQYWDFDFSDSLNLKDEQEYIEELDRLFSQAVKRQLMGDVEIGSYLSGGIDSGAISAIASKKIPELKTFTIGFDLSSASGLELSFDERAKAEHLSYLFQTEHYERVLKSGDMEKCLPHFAYHLEEPRVGQSYPNYYASKLATKFVKVTLSGIGGDELFAGYPWRYYHTLESMNFKDYIDRYYSYWQRLIPTEYTSKIFMPISHEVNGVDTKEIFANVFKKQHKYISHSQDYINHSLYFEAKTFLHGLLVVEDKLSMAHSLETRVPFLDNDLVDFAQKIPLSLKLSKINQNIKINENDLGNKKERYLQKSNDGKNILRKMLERYVPANVTQMPKQGFSSPDASWFKGESIEFVKAKLLDKNAKIYNYLDRSTIQKLINEHLNGKQNRRLFIWSLLNLQQWCEMYE